MAWHRIGNKPLSEPMLTWFTDAYMPHSGGDELSSMGNISSMEKTILCKKMFIVEKYVFTEKNIL